MSKTITERLNTVDKNLNNLLDYANAKTEKADADIGEAIRTLVEGYGQGGGSGVELVESGDYILESDSGGINIPLTKEANCYVIYLDLDAEYTTIPTKALFGIGIDMLDILGIDKYYNMSGIVGLTNINRLYRGAKGVNTSAIAPSSINGIQKDNNGLKLRMSRASTSYPIIVGTYHWATFNVPQDNLKIN